MCDFSDEQPAENGCLWYDMFALQARLNARVGVPDITDPLLAGSHLRQAWVLNMVRAIQQECAELTDAFPWKWWAKYQQEDLQNAREEAVDILHFLISVFQLLDMDAGDVYRAYRQKMDVNLARQDSGYTEKTADSTHVGTVSASRVPMTSEDTPRLVARVTYSCGCQVTGNEFPVACVTHGSGTNIQSLAMVRTADGKVFDKPPLPIERRPHADSQ